MVIDPTAVNAMLLSIRQALLLIVDAIEVYLKIRRTSRLRKEEHDLEFPSAAIPALDGKDKGKEGIEHESSE